MSVPEADMKALMAGPKGSAKGAPAPAEDPAADDDTLERNLFDEMKDAEDGGERDGEFNSLVAMIRECVKKELDKGY